MLWESDASSTWLRSLDIIREDDCLVFGLSLCDSVTSNATAWFLLPFGTVDLALSSALTGLAGPGSDISSTANFLRL